MFYMEIKLITSLSSSPDTSHQLARYCKIIPEEYSRMSTPESPTCQSPLPSTLSPLDHGTRGTAQLVLFGWLVQLAGPF